MLCITQMAHVASKHFGIELFCCIHGRSLCHAILCFFAPFIFLLLGKYNGLFSHARCRTLANQKPNIFYKCVDIKVSIHISEEECLPSRDSVIIFFKETFCNISS